MKLEKIEYKPISVHDLLIEMKNLSELMIDLAYSAALFNSKDLAEDVLELEKHIDTLSYLLDMNTMIAARDAKDAESLLGVLTVASSTNKISDAAADIAHIVLGDIGIHPIVREAFKRVEEHITRVEIKPRSTLVNKKLEELELAAEIGVNVIAIRRNKKWIINPHEEEIMAGDIIIARGSPTGADQMKEFAKDQRLS